jgi:hypothetical protein
MKIEIAGPVTAVEVIVTGRSLRDRKRLVKFYGRGRWRKLKGFADIRLPDGRIGKAEIHWYEAHGIGRKEIKIKRLID